MNGCDCINNINSSSNNYDVIVIGAGHAGCEAALAAARMGMRTAIFTLSLDTIANLPCNPCIGGTAKGQLVSEIDALGGEMGKAADATMLQSRILNKGKGAAVHSLRVQTDRTAYHLYMKHVLEKQNGLDLKQAEIVELIIENDKVTGIKTLFGVIYNAKAVIITTGTYLGGIIHIGENSFASGADGIMPANKLAEFLKSLNINMRRFKTGTPARINRRSIDFSKMESQDGDDEITPFSFDNDRELVNRTKCYITYTNSETHKIIMENLHLSPLYSGRIEGIGPRYCPSIEDKVVRFHDKERHQLFVEPMGIDTQEYYLQGMSSSLPEDVQIKFMRTIKGLENVEVMRPAYAIEYDCCDPLELFATLEFKKIDSLYGAGQFNCTSGYEEAAAQGLIAGINAALKIKGEEKFERNPRFLSNPSVCTSKTNSVQTSSKGRDDYKFVLDRASSYIGTLIDDLVTKGCSEPYRMMTSRSEYRLLLRQDNAPERLCEVGYRVGLLVEERYNAFLKSDKMIKDEINRIHSTTLKLSDELNEMLVLRGTSKLSQSVKLYEILKRPQISYKDLMNYDINAPVLPQNIINKLEAEIKYEGYIKIQKEQIMQMRKLESKSLPPDMDYSNIKGLRTEAQEKLNKHKPLNIGQAGRISGVNPADITVLLIWLSSKSNGKE